VIDTTVPVTNQLQASIVFEQPSTRLRTPPWWHRDFGAGRRCTRAGYRQLLNHGSTPVVGANVPLDPFDQYRIHASAASTNASGIVTFTVTDTVAESVLFTQRTRPIRHDLPGAVVVVCSTRAGGWRRSISPVILPVAGPGWAPCIGQHAASPSTGHALPETPTSASGPIDF